MSKKKYFNRKCRICGAEFKPRGNQRYCVTCQPIAKELNREADRLRRKATAKEKKQEEPDYQWKCKMECKWWSLNSRSCDRYMLTGEHYGCGDYQKARQLMLEGKCPHYEFSKEPRDEDQIIYGKGLEEI